MKRQRISASSLRTRMNSKLEERERRAFARVDLPAAAFAMDKDGNDLGRVVDISGGGLQIDPASPWARLSLSKGQQLIVTVVEPGTENKTEMPVEVRYVRTHTIGLRFL